MVSKNSIEVYGFTHKYTYTSIFILIPTKFGTKFTIFNWRHIYFQIFEVMLSYTQQMWKLRI